MTRARSSSMARRPSSRTRRGLVAPLLLSGLLASLLPAACAAPPRPVAVVAADRATLRLDAAPMGLPGDTVEARAVAHFLDARFPGRRSGLHVHIAGGGPARHADIAKTLVALGVPPDNIRADTTPREASADASWEGHPPPHAPSAAHSAPVPYKGHGPGTDPYAHAYATGLEGVVTLHARRLHAQGPHCGREASRMTGLFGGASAGRGGMPALGCTSDAALAASIADPRDLLSLPRHPGTTRGTAAANVLPPHMPQGPTARPAAARQGQMQGTGPQGMGTQDMGQGSGQSMGQGAAAAGAVPPG